MHSGGNFVVTKNGSGGNGDWYISFGRLGKKGNSRFLQVTIKCHHTEQPTCLAKSTGENVPVPVSCPRRTMGDGRRHRLLFPQGVDCLDGLVDQSLSAFGADRTTGRDRAVATSLDRSGRRQIRP